MKEYLTARLAYEVDVLDASAGLASGEFVVVDTRKRESWDHGHALGATHVPADRLRGNLTSLLPVGCTVVVYGWGPGCNGGTQAAAVLSERGYSVREMIGGFEYWYRSGLPVETSAGIIYPPIDSLVGAEGGPLSV